MKKLFSLVLGMTLGWVLYACATFTPKPRNHVIEGEMYSVTHGPTQLFVFYLEKAHEIIVVDDPMMPLYYQRLWWDKYALFVETCLFTNSGMQCSNVSGSPDAEMLWGTIEVLRAERAYAVEQMGHI